MQLNPTICCFVFILTISVTKINGQTKSSDMQLIRARVVIEGTHNPVVYARVINTSRLISSFTDTLGLFSIPAHKLDTLYINCIGYYPKAISISDSLFKQVHIAEITLKEKVYELSQVEINSLGNYDQFKYNVLHLNLPKDPMIDLMASLQNSIKSIPKHPLQPQASISLGSPVTALYMMFSKEGKSLRNLKRTIEEEKTLFAVYKKYNRDIAAKVTGLTGEPLNRFMLYCRPDDLFILMSNEYEICKKISECFVTFKQETNVKVTP